VVILWDNKSNLFPVMNAIAEITGRELVVRAEEGIFGDPSQYSGKLAGLVTANSIQDFLSQLQESLALDIHPDRLVLTDQASAFPVYYKVPFAEFKGASMDRFCNYLSRILGYEVQLDEALREETVTFRVFNKTWEELLKALELDWRVVENENEKILLISRGEDRKTGGN
jgi:hypothetical protein